MIHQAAEALSNTERNLPISQVITSALNNNTFCQAHQLSTTFRRGKRDTIGRAFQSCY